MRVYAIVLIGFGCLSTEPVYSQDCSRARLAYYASATIANADTLIACLSGPQNDSELFAETECDCGTSPVIGTIKPGNPMGSEARFAEWLNEFKTTPTSNETLWARAFADYFKNGPYEGAVTWYNSQHMSEQKTLADTLNESFATSWGFGNNICGPGVFSNNWNVD